MPIVATSAMDTCTSTPFNTNMQTAERLPPGIADHGSAQQAPGATDSLCRQIAFVSLFKLTGAEFKRTRFLSLVSCRQ
jgi:hypothetical protein